MKQLLISLLLLLLVVIGSCTDKKGLELEILNKSIISLKKNTKEDNINSPNSSVEAKLKTILVYKLTNNDKKTYYFNLDFYKSKIINKLKGLSINKCFITIYDDKGKEIQFKYGHLNPDYEVNIYSKTINKQILKLLNYPDNGNQILLEKNNFFIHPNEIIYFEWFLLLPDGNFIQNANIEFDYKKKYFASIEMFSDSTDYKKNLSRVVLKTIKDNKYEVYHGIIKSINEVPIIFRE